MKRTIAAAAAALMIAGAGASIAEARTPRSGHGKGRGAEMIARHLGLSEQQKESIRAIRESYKPRFDEFRDEMKDARRDYRLALEQNDPRATQLRESMEARRDSMKSLREEMQKRIEAVLTPEQRAKVAEMKQRRDDRRHNRRGGDRGRN